MVGLYNRVWDIPMLTSAGRLLENTLEALELSKNIPKLFVLQTGGKVRLMCVCDLHETDLSYRHTGCTWDL